MRGFSRLVKTARSTDSGGCQGSWRMNRVLSASVRNAMLLSSAAVIWSGFGHVAVRRWDEWVERSSAPLSWLAGQPTRRPWLVSDRRRQGDTARAGDSDSGSSRLSSTVSRYDDSRPDGGSLARQGRQQVKDAPAVSRWAGLTRHGSDPALKWVGNDHATPRQEPAAPAVMEELSRP